MTEMASYFRRPFSCGMRPKVKLILLLCEGKKTEPNYFRQFPYNHNLYKVKVEQAMCTNPSGIVDEAILQKKDDYESIWCVFDKDNNTDNEFNSSITRAKSHGINCAYTNECFELWYLLHFQPNKSALHRQGQGSYSSKLSAELKKISKGKYEKNRADMYEILKSRQAAAIKNAESLLRSFPPSANTPSKQNPSTTAHLLIRELNCLPK